MISQDATRKGDIVRYTCPVCGYDELNEEPWSEHSGSSDEFCPSCGIQFGYHDDVANHDVIARGEIWKKWRQKWVENGMPWSSVGIKPPSDWDPVKQLKNVTKS